MTSSRIVRGTKGRVFVYIVGVILITAVIACYNNTLSQLEDVRKGKEVCNQENENLSTQLQMVSDYKQRLEKSLKTEKAEHQQSKSELTKLSEEKSKNEKTAADAKVQLSSLQQHYNLLQTQHDDFKQKCSETQQEQLSEMKKLQSKFKEIEEELKKVKADRENLKSEYIQLQVAKERVEEELKGIQSVRSNSESEINRLTKENEEFKSELQNKNKNPDRVQAPDVIQNIKAFESSTSSLKQVKKEVSDDKQLETNGDEPPAHDSVAVPNDGNENVLALPSNENAKNVSPSGVVSKAISRASLDGARPLGAPTETAKQRKQGVDQSSNVLPMPYAYLPPGVVPVPNKELDSAKKTELDDKNTIDNQVDEALPNRYRSNIIENERANEEKAKISERDMKLQIKLDEAENAAHEVFDAPLLLHVQPKDDTHHINMLGVGNNQAKEGHIQKIDDGQEGLEYDKEGQNEALVDDPEGDDDGDDYGARPDKA